MEFNNNITEDREDRRKKEVEDLISKYAKKKDKDEVIPFYLSKSPLKLFSLS